MYTSDPSNNNNININNAIIIVVFLIRIIKKEYVLRTTLSIDSDLN